MEREEYREEGRVKKIEREERGKEKQIVTEDMSAEAGGGKGRVNIINLKMVQNQTK